MLALIAGRFGILHVGAAAAVGLILGLWLASGWHPLETYDACMLREMRGQPPSSLFLAYRACQGKPGAQ